MRLAGIDYGSKRVGVALSDESGRFALPFAVLPNDADLVPAIATLCRERSVGTIVVGESRTLAGQPNPIMSRALSFARELRAATNLPIEFEPEFYTSAEAERLQGKIKDLDASAAALILKSYIDKQAKS